MSAPEPDTQTAAPWRALVDQPYLLLLLTILFWSGNFILGRAVRGEVPPIALAFWRWMGGFLLVLGFALPGLRRDWPVLLRHWRILLVFSAAGIAAFNTLSYIGLQYTAAINGLLMQSTMPLLIVLFSFAFFGERLRPVQMLGVAVSFTGVLAIVARGDPARLLALTFNQGDLWLATAVVCYAAYSALLRLRPPVAPFSFVAATFLVGALMLLPFYLWESLTVRALRATPLTFFAIGYVAVFPSILAYLCWNRGVELVGANRAGLFLHLMPVFGSLMAIAFLGEVFQGFHAMGMALILSGIFLASRR